MEKILIFGGSSKLGIQIVKHFLCKKKFFIISTYNKNNKSYLFKNNKNIKFFFLNFLRKRQSINTVKKIFLKYRPNILIFNAAFLPKKKFFINITDKELINVFFINFFFLFFYYAIYFKKF